MRVIFSEGFCVEWLVVDEDACISFEVGYYFIVKIIGKKNIIKILKLEKNILSYDYIMLLKCNRVDWFWKRYGNGFMEIFGVFKIKKYI